MIRRLLAVTWTLLLAAFASAAVCFATNMASAETLSRVQVNELKIARQALKDERTAMTTQLLLNALKIKVYQDWFNAKQPSVLMDRTLPSIEALTVGGVSTYAISGAQLHFVTRIAGSAAPYVVKIVKGSPVIAAAVVAYYVSQDYVDYRTSVSSLDNVPPANRLVEYRKLIDLRDRLADLIRDESLEINKLDTQLRIYDVADKD